MTDICKTDLQRAMKYLLDAADLYDRQPGQRAASRAWCIRRLTAKINRKLCKQSDNS